MRRLCTASRPVLLVETWCYAAATTAPGAQGSLGDSEPGQPILRQLVGRLGARSPCFACGHRVHKWPLGQLVAKRDLLYMLTWREIRIKYKQSLMGMLWAILMPVLIVSAGIVVRVGFSLLSGRPIEVEDVA